jgi:hypothetical protein
MAKRLAPADAALLLASIFISYFLVEVGYRYFQYHSLLDEIVAAAVVQTPMDGEGSSIDDPHVGYRYRANIEVGPAARPFPVHYRTNSHGLIAREDFPLAKPAGEYRIGVVGDSFTANVTSTLRWTDVLEDRLAASPEWSAIVGGRRTRVINFALDGIGTIQFGAVAEFVAPSFDLDLLIVNMLKNDVIRKPYLRRRQGVVTPQDISAFVRDHVMTELNWFELHPEVLAVITGGRLGLSPHLSMQAIEAAFSKDYYFTEADVGAAASAGAIETILDNFPAAIFLLDRSYAEYLDPAGLEPERSLEEKAFAALRAQFPAIRWHEVLEPDHAPKSLREVDSWFNVPSDQHKNDLGVRIYGEAVAAFLVAQCTATTACRK